MKGQHGRSRQREVWLSGLDWDAVVTGPQEGCGQDGVLGDKDDGLPCCRVASARESWSGAGERDSHGGAFEVP